MDRFVVRGISANDAAENLQRQVDQHDEMLHRRALDRDDAATAKRGPGRPRKLSSIGLLLARDPAASPSTPPPPSRTGRSHANWWHPASIRPILQAVPAKPSVKPAAATADGPTIRKRGRPLGSRNKPKPPAAQATPTPPRKQARLVCNTSSSANSSSANTSTQAN
ncbi:hypothetical protein QJQ45_002056 [Haematococcus lacustris]|nr:hypothetical protein QJQ45_002056 [Haematococcus lacustris]